jgi:hypothetical protein
MEFRRCYSGGIIDRLDLQMVHFHSGVDTAAGLF